MHSMSIKFNGIPQFLMALLIILKPFIGFLLLHKMLYTNIYCGYFSLIPYPTSFMLVIVAGIKALKCSISYFL